MEYPRELINWLLSDDTGISSKNICKAMLGLGDDNEFLMAPSDRGDRERCIRLLKIMPNWFDRLEGMKMLGGDWIEQIDLIIKEYNEQPN